MTNSAGTSCRTIMLATDFSATAKRALEWARSLAVERDAELLIVHALALTESAIEFVELSGDIRWKLEESARQELKRIVTDLCENGDLKARWHLGIGHPRDVILQQARDHDVDLLVLGTRGLRGVEHFLMGSIAETVAQRATMPVLSVHPSDRLHARPVRRILAATDFSSAADEAIDAGIAVLGSTAETAEIRLLHAYQIPYDLGSQGFYATAVNVQLYENVESQVQQRLDQSASRLHNKGFGVIAEKVTGFAADEIVEKAAEHDVDLIIVGTHGRSGIAHLMLGSTAQKVIQRAPCPVLSVRTKAES